MGIVWGQLVFADAERKTVEFSIARQSLAGALTHFAVQSDLTLSYRSKIVADLQSSGLRGTYRAEEALRRLLEHTSIQYRFSSRDSVVLGTPETSRPERITTPLPSDSSTGDSVALGKVTVSATAKYDANDPYNPNYNRPNATTATRTDTPIMETPVSIQVVPQQVLKDQQVITLQDALKKVSGVGFTPSSSNLVDAFVIRGFPVGDTSRLRNGQWFIGFFNADLANIEQVEVLKGPAVVLYGCLEPGGLVNLNTKKPLDQPYYSLQQQFGSDDFFRKTIDASGPIDTEKTLLNRFDLNYPDAESFRKGNYSLPNHPCIPGKGHFNGNEGIVSLTSGITQRLER
ncbi:MAG: TonB-dependent siderophore receptor [Methylococcales bacterium]